MTLLGAISGAPLPSCRVGNGLIYQFKEPGDFDFEYSSNILLWLDFFLSFFTPMLQTKANMIFIFIYFLLTV